MGTDACIIKNYCPADLDRFVRFHSKAESICRSEDTFLLASLAGKALEPIDFPEENLFLAEEKGAIVGACRVVPELAINRVVLRLSVKPGLIGQEILIKLLRSALKRVGGLNVAKVHADLRENDRAARELFAGFGFSAVRRYTDMTLDLDPASIMESEYEGLMYCPLKPGGEAEFTQLQNRAFRGSWGFCPNTTAEIVRQLNTTGYGHDGVILAYRAEKAIGYCWTAEAPRPDRKGGAAIGRIHMMGIVPEFRGRGLGDQILRSGLKHLAGKGIRTVELTVDNGNKAACSLYEKAGFKPKTALLWYEKRMR